MTGKPLGEHWRRRMTIIVQDEYGEVSERTRQSLQRMIVKDARLEANQSPIVSIHHDRMVMMNRQIRDDSIR
jgi:hypothetical protein